MRNLAIASLSLVIVILAVPSRHGGKSEKPFVPSLHYPAALRLFEVEEAKADECVPAGQYCMKPVCVCCDSNNIRKHGTLCD